MRDLTLFAAIGVMGALGAISRYTVQSWTSHWDAVFPVGTLLVNVGGCFFLGALAFVINLDESTLSPTARAAIGAGFLGALTTFSTFGVETFDRFVRGQWEIATTNIVANLVLGLFAVWLGRFAARICFGY